MEEMSSIVRQNSESATSADHLSEQAASKAVVDQEVRKLSVRTTDSSQQIRALIEDITQRISEGSAQAIRSGDGIEEALDCLVLKNKIRSGKRSKKVKRDSIVAVTNTATLSLSLPTRIALRIRLFMYPLLWRGALFPR